MLKKDKMKQVIHYIVSKCDCKSNVGKTVLTKLLYFSDFNYYEIYEKSITNNTYFKYPQGPFFQELNDIINELEREGNISVTKVLPFPSAKYPQYSYGSKKDPNIDLLKQDELDVIDSVIAKLSYMTGREISEYSHGDMPWQVADMHEELGYEYVFYRNDDYSVRDYDA